MRPPIVAIAERFPVRPWRHRTVELIVHKFGARAEAIPLPWKTRYRLTAEGVQFFFTEVPEGVATVAMGGSYANKVPVFRGWERQGMVPHGVKKNGFCPYHFCIEKDGRIVQMLELLAKGAHAAGVNGSSIGIAVLGDFERERPSIEQLVALAQLCRWLRSPEMSSELKADQGELSIVGHDDVRRRRHQSPKGCPGVNLDLDGLRLAVEEHPTWKTCPR